MIKDLLVPIIGGSDREDAPLSAAIAIANAYSSHIAAVLPAPMLSAAQTPWGVISPSLLESLLEEEERATRRLVAALHDRLRDRTPSWDVRVDSTRLLVPPAAMAAKTRHADLSVIRAPADDADDVHRALFSALLFESGRPVLVVPANREVRVPFRNAVAAWKDTRECTRALHDALALFAPKSMQILVVDPPRDDAREEEPGAGIALHVSRHVPNVDVTTRGSGTMSIATTVLLHAAEHEADLIIAGGYGHSRFREWVLGGTTRELLQQLDTPVLFSH